MIRFEQEINEQLETHEYGYNTIFSPFEHFTDGSE